MYVRVYYTIPRDPCTQILPTLGPKVCKYYLHWAIWIPREYQNNLLHATVLLENKPLEDPFVICIYSWVLEDAYGLGLGFRV